MACCACHPPTLQLGRPVGHPGGAWTLPRGLHTVSRIAALPEDASAGSCPHRKAALERIPTLAGLPVEREVPSTWRRSLALVARALRGNCPARQDHSNVQQGVQQRFNVVKGVRLRFNHMAQMLLERSIVQARYSTMAPRKRPRNTRQVFAC